MNATDMSHDQVWVQPLEDDSATPLTGLVVGWPDEDHVLVVWGEAAHQYPGQVFSRHDSPVEARVEAMDDLTPARKGA